MKLPNQVRIGNIQVIDGQFVATVRASRRWLAGQFIRSAWAVPRYRRYLPLILWSALRIWRGK